MEFEVLTEHSFCPTDTLPEAIFLGFLCISSFDLTDLDSPPSVGILISFCSLFHVMNAQSRILRAALTSRSYTIPQVGHIHVR